MEQITPPTSPSAPQPEQQSSQSAPTTQPPAVPTTEQAAQPSTVPLQTAPVEVQSASQSAQEPPVPKGGSGLMKKVLLVLVGLLVLIGAVGAAYYLGWQNKKSQVTGQNAVITRIPTKVPTATPTPDPTASWQTYTNAKYSYSVKYPTGLTPNEQNTSYHYVEFKNASSSSLPAFLVSVIPQTFTAQDVAAYNYMSSDWIASLSALKTGESKTTTSGAVFTRMSDTTVDGKAAMVAQVVATGYKQQRVYVTQNNNYYMISNYYQDDSQLPTFQLFLSSFHFSK